MAGERGEVRTGTKTGLQLRRLPVRPQGGQGQTQTRALADLNRQDIVNPVRSGLSGPTVYVPYRTSDSHRKTSPPRLTSHETHTVALKEQLEDTRISGKGDTRSQVSPPSLKVVAGGKQCSSRSTIIPTKTCSADIYRRIKRRVGRSLKQTHCKGNLVSARKQVAHKSLGAKANHYINKEGGDEVGLPVCPIVEIPVLVHQLASNSQGTSHPRPAERDSRQAIQARPDHPDGMVPSPRSVQSYILPVAPATGGPVCHQIQQQTTTVCITGSGPPGMGSGCTQPIMENLDPYAFPPAAILGKVVEKLQDYPSNRIILIAQGGPTCPGFGI